jgi:hypothetical protein
MLELFFKHLDYIGIQSGRDHEPCEKRGFKFTDAETQKHWLSFYATYMRGRKSAFDDLGVWAVQNVGKFSA